MTPRLIAMRIEGEFVADQIAELQRLGTDVYLSLYDDGESAASGERPALL